MRPHLSKQRITVQLSLDPMLPPLQLDCRRVKEALVNILFNAAQAIDAKTMRSRQEVVSVESKRIVLRETLRDFEFSRLFEQDLNKRAHNGAEVVLPPGTECALVTVSDTGTGIPASILDRIFDPFFTTKQNGTGLGLPMVKQTVNAHGGIVTVLSKKGQGATFNIYLPIGHGGSRHA